MKSWYLIYCKPQQERIARDNLERQGYVAYLPLAPVRRRRKGRTVRIIDPIFPRYLFIYLSDQTDDWGPIRSTIGVSSLVRFGQVLAKVPDSLIEGLRVREDSDGIQEIPEGGFKFGDKVRIAEGIMEGFEAIFQCQKSKERVILLLKIAENTAKIEIESSQIEPT
jgi:transcriptional antiterminator RfaH